MILKTVNKTERQTNAEREMNINHEESVCQQLNHKGFIANYRFIKRLNASNNPLRFFQIAKVIKGSGISLHIF